MEKTAQSITVNVIKPPSGYEAINVRELKEYRGVFQSHLMRLEVLTDLHEQGMLNDELEWVIGKIEASVLASANT